MNRSQGLVQVLRLLPNPLRIIVVQGRSRRLAGGKHSLTLLAVFGTQVLEYTLPLAGTRVAKPLTERRVARAGQAIDDMLGV